jgi:DNA polymerase-3 subunit delta'
MNWNIIGHQWAVDLLTAHIQGDSLRHAYLFTGPTSIGKRTLALRFTQALTCPNPNSDGAPCLTCHTCRRIEKMEHPDLFPVRSQKNSLVIKVDQIREVIHNLSLSAYEAPYRVALFLNFEEAHDAAANALLKTLEEPPPQAVLMITAESSDSLLETIVSRCEEIRLRPVPIDSIQEGLQTHYQITPSQAEFLAHVSGGRPGYALQLHQNPQVESQREKWLDDHDQLLHASRVQRFAYAKKISDDSDSLQDMIKIWTSLWRDIMLTAAHSQAPLHNVDRKREIDAIAARIDPKRAREIIADLERAQTLINHYANTQLTAEVLLLDLPKLESHDQGGKENL